MPEPVKDLDDWTRIYCDNDKPADDTEWQQRLQEIKLIAETKKQEGAANDARHRRSLARFHGGRVFNVCTQHRGSAVSNDGFRVVIDRRGSQHFWTLTVNGEQHEGPRGSPTMGLAAENADVFRKQLDLSRYFKQKRQKREASSRSN
ncbi:MAG: hypothetical protein ACM3IH_02420 [Sphingobacteriales bacterium]